MTPNRITLAVAAVLAAATATSVSAQGARTPQEELDYQLNAGFMDVGRATVHSLNCGRAEDAADMERRLLGHARKVLANYDTYVAKLRAVQRQVRLGTEHRGCNDAQRAEELLWANRTLARISAAVDRFLASRR